MKLHVITGLPRAGSTLLCNVLNQNPRFNASSTSGLLNVLMAMRDAVSASSEVRSDTINDAVSTEARLKRIFEAVVREWHADREAEVVFDKSRGWVSNAPLLDTVAPGAKLLVCVRDLREVFASVEKQNQRFPIFEADANPIHRTAFSRAERFLAQDGLIGLPANGIVDLVQRKWPHVVVVRYETFVKSPKAELRRIYAEIGEEYHDGHQFTSVENTADDVDPLYLGKYPHDGSGTVRPSQETWRKYVPEEVAKIIMNGFPAYNACFGYTQ